MVKFNTKIPDELFILVNNTLLQYTSDGGLLSEYEFECNMTLFVQHEDTVIVMNEDGAVVSFDWANGRVIEERNDVSGGRSCCACGEEGVLAVGTSSGSLSLMIIK